MSTTTHTPKREFTGRLRMISLPDAEVHIWRASLDPDEADYGDAWNLLSDDERIRAGRFRFERDRRRFVMARAVLRRLLSQYTDHAPAQVAIAYGSSGKPRVAASFHLHFNLSHSQDQAVLALARHDVGVDIEATRPVPDALTLAERFFAPDEIGALRATPTSYRTQLFLRLWTRKEAYVKACGDGLSLPLDSFSVIKDDAALGDWRLHDINVEPGFTGALAVHREASTVVEQGAARRSL